jgi:hypothetical protein
MPFATHAARGLVWAKQLFSVRGGGAATGKQCIKETHVFELCWDLFFSTLTKVFFSVVNLEDHIFTFLDLFSIYLIFYLDIKMLKQYLYFGNKSQVH